MNIPLATLTPTGLLRASRPAFTKREANRIAGRFKRLGGRYVRIAKRTFIHPTYMVYANVTYRQMAEFASDEAQREAAK